MLQELLPLTVSTVVRLHREDGFNDLEVALASLAGQSHSNIQAIVCLQNPSDRLISRVQNLIRHNWPEAKEGWHQVIPVSLAEAQDGRSHLLNAGIHAAKGQFLAFLDYDDVLLPQAYRTLIDQSLRSRSCIIAGGCEKVVLSGGRVIERSPFLSPDLQVSILELLYGNFLPIHSYLINREALGQKHINFDTEVPLLEDYKMLLNLVAHGATFDFTLIRHPVCEYRLRTDGTNSVLFGEVSDEKSKKWREAADSVTDLKSKLRIEVSFLEISNLIRDREILRESFVSKKPSSRIKRLIKALLFNNPTLIHLAKETRRRLSHG